MSKNSSISISFKIEDGADGLKTLTMDAKNLKTALESTVKAADNLKKPFINFAAFATGISAVQNTITQLQAVLSGLTSAYKAQIEAETQLATNMRNTMSATEAEIESIKELCSAQQQIGVIGDEVQLAGAQELATYLTKKKTLEQLIPVMNDMVAQQYGYNASAENAAGIATMLGKVMDGQVKALSRYGYKFDEAQEKILKFGSEEERAAVLADVITSSIGGMNEALAQAPFGPVKQLSNTLGDLKEELGRVAVKIQPVLDIGASAVISVSGVISLQKSIKTMDASMKAASVSAKVLKWSIRSLLVASGVGVAFLALSSIFELFAGKENEVGKQTEALTQEMNRFSSEIRDTSEKVGKYADAEISRLDRLYKAATDETKSRKERVKAAKELQAIYPQYFSNMSAEDIALGKARKGYDDLTAAIMKNARVKAAADKIVENESQAWDLERKKSDILAQQKALLEERERTIQEIKGQVSDWVDQHYTNVKGEEKEKIRKKHIDHKLSFTAKTVYGVAADLIKKRDEIQNTINSLGNTYAEYSEKADEIVEANKEIVASYGLTIDDLNRAAAGIGNFMPEASETVKKEKTRLQQIDDEIGTLRNSYVSAGADERLAIMAKVAALDEEKRKIEDIIKAFDERGSYDFTVKMSNAEFEITEGGMDGIEQRLSTIDDLSDAIAYLQQKQNTASAEEIIDIQKVIIVLKEKLRLLEELRGEYKKPVFNADAFNLKDINDNLSVLEERLQSASIDEAASINQEIKAWKEKAEAIRNAGVESEKYSDAIGKGCSIIGSSLAQIGGLIDDTTGKWLAYAGQTLQTIPQLIEALTALTAAKAASSAAETPIVGWLMVGAAVASTLGALATIPKFAEGGIVSGPTVGLIGEYAGASHNPEVIAPLSDLTHLIRPQGIEAGRVEFIIEGRVLKGILQRTDNVSNRS